MSRDAKKQSVAAEVKLKELLTPGDKVYTFPRHISRSRMRRSVAICIIRDGKIEDIAEWVVMAGISTLDNVHGGVKEYPFGSVVREVARVLFGSYEDLTEVKL